METAEDNCCSLLMKSFAALGRQFIEVAAHARVLYLLLNWNVTILAALAAGFSLFFYFFEGIDEAELNWTYVSFAVVYPAVFFIQNTWGRRELALAGLASVKGLALAIYLCNRDWVRPNVMDPEHIPKAQLAITNLLETLREYLLMPRLTTRDLFFDLFHEKRFSTYQKRRAQYWTKLYKCMSRLSKLAGNLRDFGMTGPERIRLGSFLRTLTFKIEQLMIIKDYRTTQGPRSLARVDAILMFILFGVYFAWVGQATGSMAFGIVMAVIFAQALGCIINIAAQLEDPFNAGTANDQVQVLRDLSYVIDTIKNDRMEGAASLDPKVVDDLANDVLRQEQREFGFSDNEPLLERTVSLMQQINPTALTTPLKANH